MSEQDKKVLEAIDGVLHLVHHLNDENKRHALSFVLRHARVIAAIHSPDAGPSNPPDPGVIANAGPTDPPDHGRK